jgi:Zn-finger nucleic acid-binding protein
MAAILPVLCPTCGKKIKKKLSWLQSEGIFCPHCGVSLDTKEFRKIVRKQEKFLIIWREDKMSG